MRKILLLFIIAVASVVALYAQEEKIIYNGCRLTKDNVIGNSDVLDSCPIYGNNASDEVKFILSHIHYPAEAKRLKQEGKVLISVIIEKDGHLSHAKVEHKISGPLDKEALRVVYSFPKWKPGILNRKPVRDRYYLIVPFTLQANVK